MNNPQFYTDLRSGHTKPAATVAAVTTANATDLATAQTLVNALKVKVNELVAALKAVSLVAP